MATTVEPAQLKGRKIGRVLTKMGLVTREQVQEALAMQRENQPKKKLGEILVELGRVTQRDVREALAGQAGMRFVDLQGFEIDDDLIAALPAETVQAYQAVPVERNPTTKKLTVALKSPDNFRAVDDLRLLLGFGVEACVGDPEQVAAIIKEHFSASSSVTDVVSDMAGDAKFADLEGRGTSIDLDAVMDAAEDNKVVQLVQLVLLQAIRDRASDIHFEPFEDEFKIRYRIDGVLYEMVPPPAYLGPAITSRVKVLANLDIAERRMPQDGRVELMLGGNPIDLRVSVLPTMYGESVVMRVLDRSNVELSIDRIGLPSEELETVKSLIHKPNGIVIVTGPTGSGKTTTLYASLASLNTPTEKILTVEDPVEYDIDGLCQCQVDPETGLTFAAALRSFLRQDPDVIFVGEVRDIETAQIAVQASLTGHLVFTTLHTNDAPSSVVRLLDLGLESFLLSATVEGVIAQRLVRTICPKCKEEYEPSEEQLGELELRPEDVAGRKFYRGKGCDHCHGSGYKGRTAIFEILVVDDAMRDQITPDANAANLRREARKRGMRTLRESGLRAVYDGRTTIDEVVRETLSDDD